MKRIVVWGISFAAAGGSFALVACSASDGSEPIDRLDNELKGRPEAGSALHGESCDVVLADGSGERTYPVGASFESADGCNECQCTESGLACTTRTCKEPRPPRICNPDVKTCPDGTTVGRVGPKCAFAPCADAGACATDTMVCPDGGTVGRVGPTCEFAPCPGTTACAADAKTCPDGSYVTRRAPRCEFAPCPAPCTKEECGVDAGLPTYLCLDGTVAGSVCARRNGVCRIKQVGCPAPLDGG
jgi:hypothetical protein